MWGRVSHCAEEEAQKKRGRTGGVTYNSNLPITTVSRGSKSAELWSALVCLYFSIFPFPVSTANMSLVGLGGKP